MTGWASSRRWFAALPGPVRGAFWMSAAAFSYSLVYVTIRQLTDSVPILELVLFRAVLGTVLMVPWLVRAGWGGLKTTRTRAYALRMVIAYSGMVCWFYGLANLPLANATSLMFTLPLFTVLLAALVLHEKVGVHRWAATAVGFVGAVIIVRPGIIEVSLAAAGVLYTALAYAGGNILTKTLVRTDTPNTVVFYMFALTVVVSAGPAAAVWVTPAAIDIPWLLALGVFAAAAQQCTTRSFAAAAASAVMPFNFLKLPFVAIIAYVWLAEDPDPWTWVGAAVICASTYYMVRQEARRSRRERPAATGA